MVLRYSSQEYFKTEINHASGLGKLLFRMSIIHFPPLRRVLVFNKKKSVRLDYPVNRPKCVKSLIVFILQCDIETRNCNKDLYIRIVVNVTAEIINYESFCVMPYHLVLRHTYEINNK